MSATLKSRLPMIAHELPLAVDDAVQKAAEGMAREAASNAPDAPPQWQGLPESIEARRGTFKYGARSGFAPIASGLGFRTPSSKRVVTESAYGIYAAWYWYFLEFGTVKSPPRPYMMPAVESGRAELYGLVATELRRL